MIHLTPDTPIAFDHRFLPHMGGRPATAPKPDPEARLLQSLGEAPSFLTARSRQNSAPARGPCGPEHPAPDRARAANQDRLACRNQRPANAASRSARAQDQPRAFRRLSGPVQLVWSLSKPDRDATATDVANPYHNGAYVPASATMRALLH